MSGNVPGAGDVGGSHARPTSSWLENASFDAFSFEKQQEETAKRQLAARGIDLQNLPKVNWHRFVQSSAGMHVSKQLKPTTFLFLLKP